VNTAVGNTDAPTPADMFLDVSSSVALGIVEMQMQLATANDLWLLSISVKP
jgi:hypothetical protein